MSKFGKVENLKAIMEDPAASPAEQTRAAALLALYAASVSYALKDGGTTEYSEWSANFNLWLYENDPIESIDSAEKELTRIAA
jgi:hypothetical protein